MSETKSFIGDDGIAQDYIYDDKTGLWVLKNPSSKEIKKEEETRLDLQTSNRNPEYNSYKEYVTLMDESDLEPSVSSDIERVVSGVVQGPFRLASDFIGSPIASMLDKEEEYAKAESAVFEAVTPEGAWNPTTNRIKDTETFIGGGLNLASYFVGGGIIYKTLGKYSKTKDLSTFKKGLISEQAVEQLIVNDPVSWNLATGFKDTPVLEYLAGDQEDNVLLNRAKMAAAHGVLATAIIKGGGAGVRGLKDAFKSSGFSKESVEYQSKKLFNKKVDDLTDVEVAEVTEAVLKAKRQKELQDPSKIVENTRKFLEDDAEGIAQIVNQNESFIHSIVNRVFTTRGFFSKRAKALQQESIHKQRQTIKKAENIVRRLKTFMDDRISKTGDESLISKVSDALSDEKYLTLKSAEQIKYLRDNYGFTIKIAKEVRDSRKLIDSLSQTLLDSNVGIEVLSKSISSNIGKYLTRSYRMYEDAGFKPDPSQVERAKEAIVKNKAGGVPLEDLKPEVLTRYVNEADIQMNNILSQGGKKSFTDYIASVRKINTELLTGRKDIDIEIRKAMGEITDPSEVILLTSKKLATATETNNFFRRFYELAGAAPKDTSKFSLAIKEARKQLEDSGTGGNFVTDLDGNVGKLIDDVDQQKKILGNTKLKEGQVLALFKDLSGKQTPSILNKNNYKTIAKDKELETLANRIYKKSGGTYSESKYIFDTQMDIPKLPNGLNDPKLQKRFNVQIQGTNSILDNKWTTPEVARALNNLEDTFIWGGQPLKNMTFFQYLGMAKGFNQKMRTVYDYTTQLRNGLGGIQFGLANGINPFNNGEMTFSLLKQEIANQATNKQFSNFYEKMLGLGVVNTSVRLGESRALLAIADETAPIRMFEKLSNVAKKYDKSGKVSSWGKIARDTPEDIYMATDDFFKMNAFVTELDWLKRANPKLAKTKKGLEELEKQAANKVKNTMPNYDRVPPAIKALREMPLGNFVAFPAEILRTSAHIMKTSLDEMLSGNAVMVDRGRRRFAGYVTTNLGWYAAGSESAHLLGWTDEEIKAHNTLQERPEYDQKSHDNLFSILKDDDGVSRIYAAKRQFIDSYYDISSIFTAAVNEVERGKLRGEDVDTIVTNAVMGGLKKLTRAYTSQAMFTEAISDIITAGLADDGTASSGKRIFDDKDIDTLIFSSLAHLAKSYSPGILLDAKKVTEAIFNVPDSKTGRPDNLKNIAIEFSTGINFSEHDPVDQFERHTKRYLRLSRLVKDPEVNYNLSSEDYANRYIKAAGDQYNLQQNFYRYILAMKDLEYSDSEINDLLKENGIKEPPTRETLINGIFTYKPINSESIEALYDEATDKDVKGSIEKNIYNMNIFQESLQHIDLHPVDEDSKIIQELLKKI